MTSVLLQKNIKPLLFHGWTKLKMCDRPSSPEPSSGCKGQTPLYSNINQPKCKEYIKKGIFVRKAIIFKVCDTHFHVLPDLEIEKGKSYKLNFQQF